MRVDLQVMCALFEGCRYAQPLATGFDGSAIGKGELRSFLTSLKATEDKLFLVARPQSVGR